MKSKELRMATEISKIIVNILQSDGNVYLPKIGAIIKENDTLRFDNSDDNCNKYTSLIDSISKLGGISIEQATLLYNRWSELVCEDGIYKIDMIGTIKDGVLEAEHKLYSRLKFSEELADEDDLEEEIEDEIVEDYPTEIEKAEPKKEEPKPKSKGNEEKKSKSMPIIWGAAILTIGLAIAAYFIVINDTQEVAAPVEIAKIETPKVEEIKVEEIPAPAPSEVKLERSYTIPSKCYVELGEETKIRTYKGKTASDLISLEVLNQAMIANPDMASKKYQVVLCAYIYGSNAGRLIIDFNEFYKNEKIDTYVVKDGVMKAVALFGSDNKLECEEYIKECGRYISTALWITEI